MLDSSVFSWSVFSWIVTALIALVTLYFVRHIQQVWGLPPGPFPLPLFGNLLMLRGEENHLSAVLERLAKKHKDVFTIWMGHRPTVVVCDWNLCQDSLVRKRNDFSGRIMRESSKTLLEDDTIDVVFNDFGPSFEALRKVMFMAVRQYSGSQKLADLAVDVVDYVGELMEKEEQPLDANIYIYLIIYNIIASSAFGQRFEVDDPEFLELRRINREVNDEIGIGLPSDAVPILKVFYLKRFAEIKRKNHVFVKFIVKKFQEHQQTYQSGDVRDFTDAVLAAKEEAAAEGKDILQYLTDGNLAMVLLDLFEAGTDTSRSFLEWTLLYITHQPEIFRRMQAEIDQNVGSRLPVQSDKLLCPYVSAVLTEVLRYRPLVDHTLEHKTTCDTQIGSYEIPKDTSVLFYIKGLHHSEEYWKDPKKFDPERFLDAEGKYINARPDGYFPFGLGRRACPGEKLALADVFLVVVRLLQKFDFKLHGSVDMDHVGHQFVKETPNYKLQITKRGK